jgi:hypothetical protein
VATRPRLVALLLVAPPPAELVLVVGKQSTDQPAVAIRMHAKTEECCYQRA